MTRSVPRRSFLMGSLGLGAIGSTSLGMLVPACRDGENNLTSEAKPVRSSANSSASSAINWKMPGEELEHERTWMCWPSSAVIWGDELEAVQDEIATIALAVADFEPVSMLCRQEELEFLREEFGSDIEFIPAPVDDLWARDTLPCFVTGTGSGGTTRLAAGRFRFNGWGGKQVHSGDTQLTALVATHLNIPLLESGITGEGGGIEVDGAGTVLAARSSWINDNRNPSMSEADVTLAITKLLGANRVIWVDGLAGADITDGHIDTLARFIDERTIAIDVPAFEDADDPWVEVAATTRSQLETARTADGEPYEIVEIVQPESPRGDGSEFLATYMNYYVCNGAVIAPEFGDAKADVAAEALLASRFPGREIVMLNIDALAGGGGGIHCATQQQPKLT